MASAFIDAKHVVTAKNADAWDGASDVVVAASGALEAKGGGAGLAATGVGQAITILGLASGYGGSVASGIALKAASQFLTVNGTVEGAIGATASAAGDTIAVAAGGEIEGKTDAIALVDRADASPGDKIENHGTIAGGHAGLRDGSNGANTIDNAGVLRGTSVGFLAQRTGGTLSGDTFINEGAVSAVTAAVDLEAVARTSIVNAGSLKASYGVIINHGASDFVANSQKIDATSVAIEVNNSAEVTISNTGSIEAKHIAIQVTSSTGVTIANSGQIEGGMTSNADAPLTIENSGLWRASAAQGGFKFAAKGNRLINMATIDASIVLSTSAVASDAGGNSLVNAGAINGDVRFRGAGNILVNSGKIQGGVTMGSGASVTNVGTIVGNVVCGGSGGAVVNNGQIDGVATIAANAKLTNTVLIDGSVTLREGDFVNDSVGQVTGAIACAKSDVFVYEGEFGAETLSHFVGGAAAGHDVIKFSTADFASFAAVEKAMSQDGANVVLRLDSSDAIVFEATKLASLVGKDFKFF